VTNPEEPKLPRQAWLVLISWGLAVLVLAGMFSAWVWRNQREQDRAMCALISVFLTGPEPLAGPSGDRSRSVRAGMTAYQHVLNCSQFDR
jgi:hypothetical protein